MWIDVKRAADGKWYSKGQPFDKFSSDWAEDQPSGDFKCAMVSSSVGYKMMPADCLLSKTFFCMTLKPTCPDGYEWVSQFGTGSSCFKIVPATFEYQLSDQSNPTKLRDVSVAEFNCMSDKTRLAVPEDEDERTALMDWYVLKEPLLSGQVSYFEGKIF